MYGCGAPVHFQYYCLNVGVFPSKHVSSQATLQLYQLIFYMPLTPSSFLFVPSLFQKQVIRKLGNPRHLGPNWHNLRSVIVCLVPDACVLCSGPFCCWLCGGCPVRPSINQAQEHMKYCWPLLIEPQPVDPTLHEYIYIILCRNVYICYVVTLLRSRAFLPCLLQRAARDAISGHRGLRRAESCPSRNTVAVRHPPRVTFATTVGIAGMLYALQTGV